MINSIDAAAQIFLTNVSRVQAQIDTASRQLSSGLKISQPSDAPDELSNLLRIRADLARSTEIGKNLAQVKTQTDTAESSLETATQLLDRAAVLATQGSNTSQTAADRADSAQEVQGILQQLVGLSQTTVQGQFVFSGDQDQTPSYDLNLANANGVDRLTTPTASRQVEYASGVTFPAAHTAQDIFDHRNPDDSLAQPPPMPADVRFFTTDTNPPGSSASRTGPCPYVCSPPLGTAATRRP